MVKITRVYTKTGDKGTTAVSHNIRLSKTSPRIIAIGEIDHLNACLGWTLAAIDKKKKWSTLKQQILRLQNELFDLGAALSELQLNKQQKMLEYFPAYTQRLEQEMDAMNKNMPSLKSFILPGGNEITARLHLTRTTCRQAEQAIVKLHESEKLNPIMLIYMNRLSDWLFVMARFIAHQLNQKEILWQPFNAL